MSRVREFFGVHEQEIMTKFYLVFNENKLSIRLSFFRDPFVQLLWSYFRQVKKEEILGTFQKDGCQYFIDPILEMESSSGF